MSAPIVCPTCDGRGAMHTPVNYESCTACNGTGELGEEPEGRPTLAAQYAAEQRAREGIAEALDNLVSSKGVLLDDERLDWLVEWLRRREREARDEQFSRSIALVDRLGIPTENLAESGSQTRAWQDGGNSALRFVSGALRGQALRSQRSQAVSRDGSDQ